MNYKELCAKTIDRRYTDITGIKKENITLESKPIKKIKDNWIIILAAIAVFIGLMLIKFNAMYFLICLALLALFAGLFIIGNKYQVTCDKTSIKIKQYFQTTNIPYKSVKNVYISKTEKSLLIRSYVLVICCEDNLSLLREFEFPLTCADINEVEAFINNFKLATAKDASAIQKDKRRSLRRIVHRAFLLVCAIIITYLLIANGVIKLP